MTKDDVTIIEVRDGLRIIVEDKQTDTLAVLEVRRSGYMQKFMAKVGLRGNFSMQGGRSMRYCWTNIEAPDVSEPERLRRKANALERGGRPAKGDPEVEWFA
jgi:hypothetical protein